MSGTEFVFTKVPPERIYFTAITSAGACPPGTDVEQWAAHVDHLATTLEGRMKVFQRRSLAVTHRIALDGTVTSVIENPVSESTQRQLHLYKVVFRADAGTRTDEMWIDKRDASGRLLFELAQGLVGKRARIVKVQRVQFIGDEPRMTGGEIVTSPYLESIESLEAPENTADATPQAAQSKSGTKQDSDATEGGEPAAPARRRRGRGVVQPDPEPEKPSKTQLLMLDPKTANAIVQLAAEHLGLSPEAVKDHMTEVIGPKDGNKPRTAAQLKKGWQTLVHAHVRPEEKAKGAA